MICDKVTYLLTGNLLDILKAISKKGAREILLNLKRRGKLTYTEIEALISNPRTTSRRLSELCEIGIIKRKVLSDKYRSVAYSLTLKGEEALKILTMAEEIQGKKEGRREIR